MKFHHHLVLLVWSFLAFWSIPAFMANLEFDGKTRAAEQFLHGERVNWFKHHGKTYGCLCEGQRAFCDHKDAYETDETIQGWVQYIKELQ